ncbi:MAG TPA: hypothetical protein VHK86_08115, partial [Nitrososphaera sp.]|nr:hypothetical protein [Nitrososphaera sp.]
MEPAEWMAILEAAGVLGNVATSQGMATAAKTANKNAQYETEAYKSAIDQANQRAAGLEPPTLVMPKLNGYTSAGTYSPEDAQALNLGQSELASYSSDPALRSAQMQAMAQLAQLGQGKLTDSDLIALQQAQLEASRADQGRQQAILQDMARRGQGGSGAELAARLQSSQSAADRASAAQQDALRAAQTRALSALAQQGAVAGSIRSQDLGEAQARAAAIDRINEANFQNRQGVVNGNTMTHNLAQQANLANRQKLYNANVDTANQQAMLPNQVMQQNFQNRIAQNQQYMKPTSDPYKMEIDRGYHSEEDQNKRNIF